MSAVDSSEAPPLVSSKDERSRTRRFLPRFGLRSLFVFAVLFSLASAWVGRNALRMRQEDAALEALEQAGAAISVRGDEDSGFRYAEDFADRAAPLGRLVGWAEPLQVSRVRFGRNSDEKKMPQALAALPAFSGIRSVDLSGQFVTDDSLIPLQRLPELESISLDSTVVTAAGLSRLGPPLRVHEARLYEVANYREISEDLVAGLAALPELRFVHIYGATLSRNDVSAIASLPELESLRFDCVNPGEPGAFEPLTDARKLRALCLTDLCVIDGIFFRAADKESILATVAKLRNLEDLYIDWLDDVWLERLGSLTNLRRISLIDVTREAAIRFSVQHPRCLVCYWDKGDEYFRGGEPVPETEISTADREPLAGLR